MRGWVKLDDGMPEHPKVAGLGDSAFRAYVCSIAYASRQLTDGYLPESVARTYANGALDTLLEAGLWEQTDDGYIVHDYLDYQRSRADVLQLREDRKAAGSKGGKASSRAKDKQVLKQKVKQNASKPQAEQELELQDQNTLVRASANGQSLDDVKTVYEHWRRERGKVSNRYRTISDARRKKIQCRLREFTVDELLLAISNVAKDPWPERAHNDDLTIILRSREQVDKFLEMTSQPATNGRGVTGFRLVRGSHGSSYVRDPAGTDRPPKESYT